jgi:nickel-type superoxide dismutase maturation protease
VDKILNVRWYPTRWPLLRVEVAEESMLPALRPGDWLLALRTRRIRPGQVVLAWHPARADFLLVKRAVRRVAGDGGWWLESDNQAAGAVDSNRFGPVPRELVVGRVLVRYWPLRRRSSPVLSRTDGTDCVGPRPCERVRGPTLLAL